MDLSALQKPVPQVLRRERFQASRIFTVEKMDLKFANGTQVQYEKIAGGRGAVMAIPFDGTHFYLSVEYAGGIEEYALGLVKGKLDPGETPDIAVNRELQEEIGYGSSKITLLRSFVTVAPGMLELCMHFFLCEDLYECRKEGDEPEPVCLVKATADEARDLVFNPDSPLKEARCIAALSLALHHIGAI